MLCAITRVPLSNAKCSVCLCVTDKAVCIPATHLPMWLLTFLLVDHQPVCLPLSLLLLLSSSSAVSSVLFCVFAEVDWKKSEATRTEGIGNPLLVEAPVYRSKSGKNDKKIVNFVVSGNCFCVWGWDEGVEVPPAALRVNHPTLRRCQVANHASGGLCVGVMR